MSAMLKYRVHEVGKDFGRTSKEITQILTDYATTPKNHMQVLEDEELSVIFEYLTQHNQIESLEEVFKETYHPPVQEKAAPAPEQKSGEAAAGRERVIHHDLGINEKLPCDIVHRIRLKLNVKDHGYYEQYPDKRKYIERFIISTDLFSHKAYDKDDKQ